jgi:hypothetical protein
MIPLKSVEKKSLIEFENLLFMMIEKQEGIDYSQLYYVDALILNTTDISVLNAVFDGTRKHYNPNVYLKPIYLIKSSDIPGNFDKICDELTEEGEYGAIALKTKQINERIEKLFSLQRFPSSEMELLYKTLQFIFTRDRALEPFPNRYSRINYSYPFISRQLADIEQRKALDVLRMGYQRGYIAGNVHDKIHLCSSCASAHYNIRETCRECGSIDLKTEDLIHHFPCAYVGPTSDFTREGTDQLQCPKCDKVLRHIGNDYDKPAHVYNCNACNADFQEATFTTHCMDCQEVQEIHHLKEYDINSWKVTSKGVQLMLHGLPKTVEKKSTQTIIVTGIYSYDIFRHLVRQEQARIQRNGSQSYLGRVDVLCADVNRMSEEGATTLQKELSKVLKSYINEHDMVSSRSAIEYFFMITDTTKEHAESLVGVIEYNFEALIKSNIEVKAIKIEVKVELLTPELSMEG